VRLNRSESGVRCLRCAASAVHLSIGLALAREVEVAALSKMDVYELSATETFVEHLRKRAARAAFFEYHPDIAPGTTWQGVRCEDVQART
jgi:hypothetical protein